jgi:hypothetical protein
VVYLPMSNGRGDPKTMSSSSYSSVVCTESFRTLRLFALRAFVNVPFLYSTWKFACTRKRDNLSEFLLAFQFKFCASSWSLFQRAYQTKIHRIACLLRDGEQNVIWKRLGSALSGVASF